jgi:hypothetical protein
MADGLPELPSTDTDDQAASDARLLQESGLGPDQPAQPGTDLVAQHRQLLNSLLEQGYTSSQTGNKDQPAGRASYNGSEPVGPGTTGNLSYADIDAATLDKQLPGVLKGHGLEFIDSGKRNNVDPRALVAIAMEETGNGTSRLAREQNNVAGLYDSAAKAYRTFNSIGDSIEFAAHNLRKNYLDQGLNDFASIGKKYAPVGAYNDPNNTNGEWPGAVAKFYSQLGGGSIAQPVNLAAAATANAGRLSTSQDPGTNGGELGCADAVSYIVRNQLGYDIPRTLSTNDLYDSLAKSGWVRVDPSTPGAVIVSPATENQFGHTGIMGPDGKTIYSNSSRSGTWGGNYTIESWSKRFGSNVYAFVPGPNAPRLGSTGTVAMHRGGLVTGYSNGGRVTKQGETDVVPAMLTPGEYVVPAEAVARIGVPTLDAIAGGRLSIMPAPIGPKRRQAPRGRSQKGVKGYQDGGVVTGEALPSGPDIMGQRTGEGYGTSAAVSDQGPTIYPTPPAPSPAPSAGAIGDVQQTAQQFQTPVPLPEESGVVPIPPTWSGRFTRSNVNPGQGLDKFANVRYNNPGSIKKEANWANQFGARTYGLTGTGASILQFPDKISGGAALFHLLNNNYVGMTLQDMAAKYTGAGSGQPGTGTKKDLRDYIDTISKATGLKATDKITPEFMAGPGGIAFVKAQSGGGEGSSKGYPMSDDEWSQSQRWGLGLPPLGQPSG